MKNNSLFKTRQLSKYRAWTGNKKGCLFYVPAKKAICIINAPWRQDDIVGKYDTLHKFEINNITQQDIILQGFSAVLLSKGPLCDESEDSVRELWKNCKQKGFYGWDIIPEYDVMAFLIREALYWTKRNPEILALHFGRETMYQINQYMCMLVQEELERIAATPEDMIFRTHALFRAKVRRKNTICTNLQSHLSPLDIYGFPAAYINYRMVYHSVGQILIAPSDMNSIAEKILNNFSEFCYASNAGTTFPKYYAPNTIKIPYAEQINFDIPIENMEELFEIYTRDMFHQNLREAVYIKFFISEVESCREIKKMKGVFSEQQKSDIMNQCEQFLIYSLKQLEDKKYYSRAVQFLIDSFPSIKDAIEKDPKDIKDQRQDGQQSRLLQYDGKLTKAIKAVHNAGICTKSDWAAVVKIMEERRFVQKAAYSSDETLINNICGETVTDKDSIARSVCMSKVKGIYPDWEIRNGEETRETPNKLNHYKEIAEVFIKALDT